MANVVVVGGGISGLSAAYYLATRGRHSVNKIIVCEAASRYGGWIRSTRLPNGAVHEHGPRSIRPVPGVGHNLLALVEELGLKDKVIPIARTHPASKNRMLLVDGKLHALPSGLKALFFTYPPFDRPLLYYLCKDVFLAKHTKLEDESMYDFVQRRFGTVVAEFGADPLCRGVYAGNAKEISVQALMKPLFEAEQKHGSVILGLLRNRKALKPQTTEDSVLVKKAITEKWASWNLQGGLQTLVDHLQSRLTELGVELKLSTPCISITSISSHMKVSFESSDVEVNHVFAALPSKNLAPLLGDSYASLSAQLKEINSLPVAVINLEYSDNILLHDAFGFLVPSNQNSRILGVIFDSCCFPTLNRRNGPSTRLTVMLGGYWFEHLFGSPDLVKENELLEVALSEINKYLNIKIHPSWHQVLIHKDSIPQYRVGHFKRVEHLRDRIAQLGMPVTLLGSSYDGVSVNDCVSSALKATIKYIKLM